MLRALGVLVLSSISCGAPPPVAPGGPASERAVRGEPSAEPTSPRTRRKKRLLSEALARVETVQLEVAALRGLELDEPVPAQHQSKDEFRAYVKREVAKELPPDKNRALSRAVTHMGLVRGEIDLARTLLDAFVTQAAAYYDPETNRFYVVMLADDPSWLDTVSAHELTHGIQHQNFDLLAYYGQNPEQKLTEDELNARRFIVEGEATLLMIAYLGKQTTKMDMLTGDGFKALRMQLGFMAAMPTADLIELNKKQMQALPDLDDEMRASVEALDRIPHYILVPLFDSYLRGTLPIAELYESGGWPAVNALYSRPPESTEQVLHPRDKLVGRRDYPIAITLARPQELEGWDELHSDVLGELQWRTYFGTWEIGRAVEAAAGWDGDRYAIYARESATTAVIATTWDSGKDAKQFDTAYRASLVKRFPDGATRTSGARSRHSRPDGTIVLVERRGSDVFVVDGAPPRLATRLMRTLRRSKMTRHPQDRGR